MHVPPEQVAALVEASPLFADFLALPDARRYRRALRVAPAIALATGQPLPQAPGRRGAFAVLSGAVALPAEIDEQARAGAAPPRLVFGQWTGLRELPLAQLPVARADSVLLELDDALLEMLLVENDLGSRFKVDFYLPLVREMASIADAPDDVLDRVIRASRFRIVPSGTPIVRQGEPGNTMFFIARGSVAVQGERAIDPVIEQGRFFGHLGLLGQQPRTSTVVAREDCLVLEVDREHQALLRKKSKTFKAAIDREYTEFLVLARLPQVDLFKDLSKEELGEIATLGSLETFEPYEPVLLQGSLPDALYVLLNGTMSVVEETPDGPFPLNWVRSGQVVGEMALLPGRGGVRRTTVTAVQDVDAIRIPIDRLGQLFDAHPTIARKLAAVAESRFAATQRLERDLAAAAALGWMMETQHAQGEAVLAIDMADCIRCGNCVAACQSVHEDGISRFFWEGMRQDDDVLPQVRLSPSCHHCEYALCMNPCPTNAIERTEGRAVVIDYDKCIRCGKCADPRQGCPYGSIRVMPGDLVRRAPRRNFLEQLGAYFRREAAPTAGDAEAVRKTAAVYPVKCDLCAGQPYQACVYHCPTDAVFRVNGFQQFAGVLQHPIRTNPGATRPPDRWRPIFVYSNLEEAPVKGKPAKLVVRVSSGGPGVELRIRPPEPGVSHVVLNLYLHAPESFRLGGGALRQLNLPADILADETEYTLTGTSAGEHSLDLCVYQGGLYLGRTAVPVAYPTP